MVWKRNENTNNETLINVGEVQVASLPQGFDGQNVLSNLNNLLNGGGNSSTDANACCTTTTITIGDPSIWTNLPVTLYGVLRVENAGYYIMQYYTALYNGRSFFRYSANKGSNWGSWIENVTESHGNAVSASNISNTNPTLATSTEQNEITARTMYDSTLGDNLLSLRHAIDFRWYQTHWRIGNLRSGGMYTAGFGFAFSEDEGNSFTLKAKIDADGTIYSNGSKCLTTANFSLSGTTLTITT